MPDEILRRLKEDQAGLGFPVELSKRRLHEYIAEHREKHGPPPDPALERIEPDTIAKLKARIVARAAREIDAIERKHRGKLKPDDATTMRRLYSFLDDAEKRERQAAKYRRQPSRAKEGGAPDPDKPESALERLEREEREGAEQDGSGAPTLENTANEQPDIEPQHMTSVPLPTQEEREADAPEASVLNMELVNGRARRSGDEHIGGESERPAAPAHQDPGVQTSASSVATP